MSKDDLADIEDLTGCVPLLLRPYLLFHTRSFPEAVGQILRSEELVRVGRDIRTFANVKAAESSEGYSA